MRQVVVAGTGITEFGKFMEATLRSLTENAVAKALADADTKVDEIDMVFYGNAAGGLLNGQECVRGQVALRHIGLLGKPIINVENACASSSTAFHLAWLAVAAGQCEVALAIGAEKMSNDDKTVPMKALEAAADREELEMLKTRISPDGSGTGSVFMDLYADLAKRYMQRTGTTARDFAAVSAKQRRAGALNPIAQFRKEVTADEVLQSRMIASPLTLMMCSPIGDGAAALVVMSADYAARKAIQPVDVLACAIRSGQGDEPDAPACATAAAKAAYEQASIGPDDVNVAEIHDAAAPAELILSEQLGFCKPGEAVKLLRSGRTSLGGDMPINPSGGLLSKGHPVGATGAAQLVELCDQLRGRSGARQRPGARLALAENGGGWIGNDAATATVTILGATKH
ncbi:MAG: thiolase family protein [Alphaproteobacteria bacterium]|nr:thiolase family protein [Alphaproteobacteria bacterium]